MILIYITLRVFLVQLFAEFAIWVGLQGKSFGDGKDFEEVRELVDAWPFFEKGWAEELVGMRGEERFEGDGDCRYGGEGGRKEIGGSIGVGADPELMSRRRPVSNRSESTYQRKHRSPPRKSHLHSV